MLAADEIQQVREGLWFWQRFQPSVKVDCSSCAVRVGTKLILIDPIPLAAEAMEELCLLGEIAGIVRKWLCWVDRDRLQLAPQFAGQESLRNQRTGAVHCIESDSKAPCPYASGVDMRQHAGKMHRDGPLQVGSHRTHRLIRGMSEIALMMQVHQLSPFVTIEKEPFVIEQFQSVIFGRIVRSGDRDAAAGMRSAHINLNRRSRQYPHPHHLAAGSEQSTRHRVFDHRTAGTRIAPHHHAPAPYVRAKGLCEVRRQRRRQELTHYATDAGDADFQIMFTHGHYSQRPKTRSITAS